jgi:hypothetical protein
MATDLSLRRLAELLNEVAEHCAVILPTNDTILDDSAIQKRVEDWFDTNFHYVSAALENAATLYDQKNLGGDAKHLRESRAHLVWRWTDTLFTDLARDATPDEVAAWQEKYGPFPMPGIEEPSKVTCDRWNSLFGRICLLGEDVRSLAQSIIASVEKQSTNDDRDIWLYNEKKAGKTHASIRAALGREHPKWEQLESEQAVGRAVDRYCHRKNLAMIRRKF